MTAVRGQTGQGEVGDENVSGGEPVGAPTLVEAIRSAAAILAQGSAVARETTTLCAEVARIGLGRSDLAPSGGDRRFADPAWHTNPVYKRIAQAYLASGRTLERVADAQATATEDRRLIQQVRFMTMVLTSALAPTNYLLTNPAALKRAFDTGGMSVWRGAGNFASDMVRNGGMPSMVDRSAFELGRDLASTPGGVIARDEFAEVIQYTPREGKVHERPVLVVPPPIGRYYFLDLRPGRSFVEYAVERGLQPFMLSWRNPSKEQGEWDLDTYAARVSRAIDEVREVTGADDINVIGFCAGGIITATLLNHLAVAGDERVHSVAFAVTLLDFSGPAPISAFSGRRLLSFVRGRSRRRGIISSRDMGLAFAWMRPDDLVFNYWVSNYLMGDKPPAFDILAWNDDGTNLPGALHCQFLDIFEHNLLTAPGGMTVLDTPIDLSRVKTPSFVVGAIDDHLTPWTGCYQTTQLLGGESEFVLSYSGHIASLVNPPSNPKAHFWSGGTLGSDSADWLSSATKTPGSWWEKWADWTLRRSGAEVVASADLGSAERPVLVPAPGTYVRERG